jgi:hypothetical protein
MKIGRFRNEILGDSYAIISADGKRLISKSDFQEQTGIPIPNSVK